MDFDYIILNFVLVVFFRTPSQKSQNGISKPLMDFMLNACFAQGLNRWMPQLEWVCILTEEWLNIYKHEKRKFCLVCVCHLLCGFLCLPKSLPCTF